MGRFLTVPMVLLMISPLAFSTGAISAQDDDAEATIEALLTQVAELEGTETTPTPRPRTPTAEAETEEDVAVNLEIIIDVSGSMAQLVDTGDTRIEAAKRVLNDVIDGVPEREGINVGLRIYGHEGDNTAAGQAESCRSSELVVPIDGVEKRGLRAAVDDLQPIGWTPIALSLERAEDDFADATEADANYIVLVTDGLETCGGDPCDVAGDLNSGDSAVTTSVIGFGLTPDEQATIGCIADEGGGDVLGAANAAELSDALFEVLSTPVPDIETPTPTAAARADGDPIPLNESFELLYYYFVETNSQLYVFGEIRNVGDAPAVAPAVVFTFLDESGVAYGDETFYPAAGLVAGGDRVPFQALNVLGSVLSPGDWADIQATAGNVLGTVEQFDPVGIEIEDVPLEGAVGPVSGSVRNDRTEPIGPLSFRQAYYDAEDRFVGHCDVYLDVAIPPGRSVDLNLSGGGCGFVTVATQASGNGAPRTYRLFL